MARQGIPPGSFEEALALEYDIAELMGEIAQNYQYVVIPAVFNEHGELILCKSWFKKRWNFVKKHKKAILIGTAVVVAATVVIASGAAGAALSGAPTAQPTEGDANPADEAVMQEAIEEQIAIFRESLATIPFSELMEEGISLEESGKNSIFDLLGHREVDSRFATDFASFYQTPEPQGNFNTLDFFRNCSC